MAGDHSNGQPPAFLLSKPVTPQSGQRPKVARKRLGLAIGLEIGRLRRRTQLLVAVQFAANHEAKFDVSDALAVVVALIGESLAGLDCLEAAS